LLVATGYHGGSTGFAVKEFTPWSYFLTQPGAIAHYLGLAFWPSGLCLNYGWHPPHSMAQVIPAGLLVLGLLGLTGWALVKRPAIGFLLASFFLILAPTSTFVPIRDAVCDHRMYLPLAAVVVLVIVAAHGLWNRAAPQPEQPTRSGMSRWLIPTALLAIDLVGLGWATVERNRDYRSDLAIWQNAVDNSPESAIANNNLGLALAAAGQTEAAIDHLRKAVAINNPGYVDPLFNLAVILADAHKDASPEAIELCRRAVEIDPNNATAHHCLGHVLDIAGRTDDAIVQYSRAVELRPDYAEAHFNLGLALDRKGLARDSATHFLAAARLEPDTVKYVFQAALALAAGPDKSIRNPAQALELAKRANQLSGGKEAGVLDVLALAYAQTGQFPLAVATARRALDLAVQQHNDGLANVLRGAIAMYEAHRSPD